MRGHHLAVYNFGLHVDDYESPLVLGFRLREPLNFEAAKRAEGYVGRSGYDDVPGPESWATRSIRVSSGTAVSRMRPPHSRSGAASKP
jgi:hypothetical protein